MNSNEQQETLNIDQFVTMILDGFRARIITELCQVVKVPCSQCGGTHYHGTGSVVPCRDDGTEHDPEDRSGDHTHEVVWFVCMKCGQVYDTFELSITPEMVISGPMTLTEGDDQFIAHVHDSVGFGVESD